MMLIHYLLTVVLSQTIFFPSTLAGTSIVAPSITIIHWKPVCTDAGLGKFITSKTISFSTLFGNKIASVLFLNWGQYVKPWLGSWLGFWKKISKLEYQKTGYFVNTTYIFTADDTSLTHGDVMRTFILINAPIASPLWLDTFSTGVMLTAVIICEISRDEILIGFRRSHTQWYQNVVFLWRNAGSLRDLRSKTRQTIVRHFCINGFGIAENAFVFSTRRKSWEGSYCQAYVCHLVDGNSFRQHLLEINALLSCC